MAEAGALIDARTDRVVSCRSSPGSTRAATDEIAGLDPRLPGRVPAPHRAAGQPAGHLRQAAARARQRGVAGRPAVAQPARVRRPRARRWPVRRAVAALPHRPDRPGHRRGLAGAAGAARRAGGLPAAAAAPPGEPWGDRDPAGPAASCAGRCSPWPGTTTWSRPSARAAWPRPTCTTRSAPRRRWSGCWTARWTGRPGPGWPARGINVGAHLLPGRGVMIAGIKTGLLLRRLLQLVGRDRPGRPGRGSTSG